MAKPGEIVECDCGTLEAIGPDKKFSWHKLPGTNRNCPRSGIPVDNWDACSSCSACEATDSIRAAKPGARLPIYCAACGNAGTLKDFIDLKKLQHQAKIPKPKAPTGPARNRYVPAPDAAPPDCPKCGRVQVRTKFGFQCLPCAQRMIEDLAAQARAKAAAAQAAIPKALAEAAYLPVTPELERAVRRAAERWVAKAPGRVIHLDLRSKLESEFEGKLGIDDFTDVFDLSERFAKRALKDFMAHARRNDKGVLQLAPEVYRRFKEHWNELAGKVAARRSDDVSDLAYLTFFGTIEEACRAGEVAFRREDMAA